MSEAEIKEWHDKRRAKEKMKKLLAWHGAEKILRAMIDINSNNPLALAEYFSNHCDCVEA